MADKLSRNMRVSMKRPRTEIEAEQLADEAFRMHQHAQHALQEMLRTRESQVSAYSLYDEITKFLNVESAKAGGAQALLELKLEKEYYLKLNDEAWALLLERRHLVEDLKLKVKVPELGDGLDDELRGVVQTELRKMLEEFVEEQIEKVEQETVYRLVEISMLN